MIQAKVQRTKPTSAGRRFVTKVKRTGVHTGKPQKGLVSPNNRKAGRNNAGRITTRHRGGGHKHHYRHVDFKRTKEVPAKVERIEYDPNRTALIALICYNDGERSYILAPKGLKVGDTVQAGPTANKEQVGNALPLRNIPVGTFIHNLEGMPGKGGQYARAAGTSAQLVAKENDLAVIRFRSGEMKRFNINCRATIGELSNSEHNLISLGKAGAKRWRGIRPTVRGVAMNPVDHPHGGGEGRTSGGRHPVSPWGQPTKGKRTRNAKKQSSKMIVRRRDKRKS